MADPPLLPPRALGLLRRALVGDVEIHEHGVVVGCVGTPDVVAARRFAAWLDLPSHVRRTAAGEMPDGVVIDLSRMRGIRVDPSREVVRVQGGATWIDLESACPGVGTSLGMDGRRRGGIVADLAGSDPSAQARRRLRTVVVVTGAGLVRRVEAADDDPWSPLRALADVIVTSLALQVPSAGR